VQINDRGPFAGNRVIDLSRAAARELGMVDDGVVPVRIELNEDDT
jgi:rare lipoprotein A